MAGHGNTHQGLYGETFVKAIAVAAGLTIAKPEPDIDGIDLNLGLPGDHEVLGVVSPCIEVQVKTWTRAVNATDVFRYPELTVGHYNKLAARTFAPRFLFLVLVPPDPAHWVVADTERLALHTAAYWAEFHSAGKITDRSRDSKHTVRVPAANLVTPQTIPTLFAMSGMSGAVW